MLTGPPPKFGGTRDILRRNRQIRRRETVTVPGQDGLHGDDRVRSDKFIETVRSAITPEMWPIESDL
jgi:hypothetical protein